MTGVMNIFQQLSPEVKTVLIMCVEGAIVKIDGEIEQGVLEGEDHATLMEIHAALGPLLHGLQNATDILIVTSVISEVEE